MVQISLPHGIRSPADFDLTSHRYGMKDLESGTLNFSVDAGLLFQLGEELVAKRSVALAELIKNAYDADATVITIRFDDVSQSGGVITISDDGSGMPFTVVADAWMRIATTRKATESTSPKFGRPRTGAKGVGRFATRRLASVLRLKTVAQVDSRRPKPQREETRLEIPWDDFRPGQEVQAVPVSYRRRRLQASAALPTGTELRLVGVRDAWGREDFRELLNDLRRLVGPAAGSARSKRAQSDGDGRNIDPGLDIRVEAPEFPEFSGDVHDQSLAGAVAVLEGRLTDDGTAKFTVTFRTNEESYRFTAPRKFPHLGPARFRIHYFNYKKTYFSGLDINVRDAARRGREEGGVHVYVDRFRVPPFGGVGDDWLKVDEDRGRRVTDVPGELEALGSSVERPMLLLPGNNQLFGRVFLSRASNPGIRQTLNREGLLENAAFHDLRSFVRLGINFLTVAFARESASERREAKAQRTQKDSAGALLQRARETFLAAASEMAPEARAQVVQAIELAQASITVQEEEFIGELSMLRVLASTGTMVVVFQHQLLGTLSGLRESHTTLTRLAKRIVRGERERLSEELSRLELWIDTARHQSELLGLLVSRQAHTRRRPLAVKAIVAALERAFASYAQENAITVENAVPANLKTPPMFQAELSAIFVNLLTNAFKAVRESPERRVHVAASRDAKVVTIAVSDTGVGADPAKWEDYFRPFSGESEPDPILGQGTGLGLKIVRDFAEVYGGSARFVAPQASWQTTVEVRLPEDNR